MKKTILIIFCLASLIGIYACGGGKVTEYEESRITSFAWAGDTLISYCKNVEKGFIAGGIKRNPRQSVELWLAKIDPERGIVDTSYRVRQIPTDIGRIEFFPRGRAILYAVDNGVHRLDLSNGDRIDFFTHPSIKKKAVQIDVGPAEKYSVIVVDAEVMPGSEGLLDLFMIDMSNNNLVFHTDSLIDDQSFSWLSEDCIAFISPDLWEESKRRILQFGVSDCIVKPSSLTENEVRCNCPLPSISASGRWECFDEDGAIKISAVSSNK
ncbi:hypothetical protein KAH81_09190 [bacterium]|nr:hypothetical protein [bacterium]